MSDQKPAQKPELQPAPELEIRTFPFVVDEVRDKNDASGDFTIKGHAAVFNKWSSDLGGFREKIAKGAFDNVLSADPHVLHLIDHDTRYVLSSTRNKTLELRTDPVGLRMYSKVAPTSYAADLRVLMERGDVDQSSFAFIVARDEWKITEDGGEEKVERTILEVSELFDVTTTAMGAYPTTDSQVATATRAHARALAEGLPDSHPAVTDPADAAQDDPAAAGGTDSAQGDALAEDEESASAQADPAALERAELHTLKTHARKSVDWAREQREELNRKVFKR